MKELFPVKPTKMLSPRLAWVRKHRLTTERRPRAKNPEEVWKAWSANYTEYPSVGYGATEEDALRDWGVRAKQTLWNELPCHHELK